MSRGLSCKSTALGRADSLEPFVAVLLIVPGDARR
jgi:hypothetical protein